MDYNRLCWSAFSGSEIRVIAMKKPVPPRLNKLSSAKQRRLDELLDKNSEGTITQPEKARLQRLVADAEQLMVVNAKRLAKFARKGISVPAGAVPVTLWVKPGESER